jgi:hypothetical protein
MPGNKVPAVQEVWYLSPLVGVHALTEQRFDFHHFACFCCFYQRGCNDALRVWRDWHLLIYTGSTRLQQG